VEYSVLALLLLRALMTRAGGPSLSLTPAIIVTVLAAAIFGGLDELRQSLVPNREPRLTDVALDTASALAACLAVACWLRVRASRGDLTPRPPLPRTLGPLESPGRRGEGEIRTGSEASP
jgi:VanZ family protein